MKAEVMKTENSSRDEAQKPGKGKLLVLRLLVPFRGKGSSSIASHAAKGSEGPNEATPLFRLFPEYFPHTLAFFQVFWGRRLAFGAVVSTVLAQLRLTIAEAIGRGARWDGRGGPSPPSQLPGREVGKFRPLRGNSDQFLDQKRKMSFQLKCAEEHCSDEATAQSGASFKSVEAAPGRDARRDSRDDCSHFFAQPWIQALKNLCPIRSLRFRRIFFEEMKKSIYPCHFWRASRASLIWPNKSPKCWSRR